MKIVNLLNRVLKSQGQELTKENEYMWWSPFVNHHKPKLQVNIKNGKWHCWVSGQGGHNLFQLFKKVKATKKQYQELNELSDNFSFEYVPIKQENKEVKLPDEYKPMWVKSNSPIYKHALKYLKSRGVSQDDMIKYSIGYCEDGLYSNRIIIPSYDDEGQLNFFIGRDIFDSKLKYRNSPTPKDIIGFDLFVNWEEPILLVEGALDAITSKVNSIPLFGKTIMNNLKRKILEKKVKTLYVALDNDAVKDSMKIVEELMNEGIKVHMIKLTEKDPNDIGYEKFTDIKNSTNETSFRELVKYKLGMI
jgi:DNA primase|tara:strand:- start:1087 stop:2001 length:915 start_codon:yes stop_codon:yes gene_type:complete